MLHDEGVVLRRMLTEPVSYHVFVRFLSDLVNELRTLQNECMRDGSN
jgi:hypothetical protein